MTRDRTMLTRLLILAVLPALAHAQATRPSLRVVEDLTFAGKPSANGQPAVPGLPAAACLSPATLNTARDPFTLAFVSRGPRWQKIDRPAIAALLAKVPVGGIVYVNTEGDPAAGYGLGRTPAENHKAHLFIRRVIRAARDARPDAQILLDCRGAGFLGWDWYKQAPPDPAAIAALAAEIRATIAMKELDGVCFQAYFVKRWQARHWNDFGGPRQTYVQGGREWRYPARSDDGRYMVPGWQEPIPTWVDLSNQTGGWAHQIQLDYVALAQYGKPVSVLFQPSYAWDPLWQAGPDDATPADDRRRLWNAPLGDDDRNECVAKLRALGVANVILWGTIRQGTPAYPDGSKEYEAFPYDPGADWLAKWRAEAGK